MDDRESYALPEDPVLAEVAATLQGAGHWGWVLDDRWRVVHVTDELRLTFGGNTELSHWPIGAHFFGPEFREATRGWRFGTTTEALFRSNFAAVGGWVLTDTPGGREELRELVDPSLRDMVDGLVPDDPAARWFAGAGMGLDEAVGVPLAGIRIRDRDGRLAGTAMISKPAAGMATLGSMTSRTRTMRHFSPGWVISRSTAANLRSSISRARSSSLFTESTLSRTAVSSANSTSLIVSSSN